MLASPDQSSAAADGEDLEVVVVEVDGRRYGVKVADVLELLPMVATTPLPGAPSIVEGVINLRGVVVPVVGVRRRIGAPARPPRPSDRLVVAAAGRRQVALRVDAAHELAVVERGSLDPPEGGLPAADHVAGVATTSDGLLVIHDLERFLTAEEAAALDAALEQEEAEGAPS